MMPQIILQGDLQRVSQQRIPRSGVRGDQAMIEVVATFLVVFSVSVFAAHAFDAYRELSS